MKIFKRTCNGFFFSHNKLKGGDIPWVDVKTKEIC